MKYMMDEEKHLIGDTYTLSLNMQAHILGSPSSNMLGFFSYFHQPTEASYYVLITYSVSFNPWKKKQQNTTPRISVTISIS